MATPVKNDRNQQWPDWRSPKETPSFFREENPVTPSFLREEDPVTYLNKIKSGQEEEIFRKRQEGIQRINHLDYLHQENQNRQTKEEEVIRLEQEVKNRAKELKKLEKEKAAQEAELEHLLR